MRQQANAEMDELSKQIGQLKVKVDLDFLKQELASSLEDRRAWIDARHPQLTVSTGMRTAGRAECDLLLPAAVGDRREPRLLRPLDELYLDCPFSRSRRMPFSPPTFRQVRTHLILPAIPPVVPPASRAHACGKRICMDNPLMSHRSHSDQH